MPRAEITKSRVLGSLRNAIFSLGTATESCGTIGEATELPKAFPVVAKHLPMMLTVFASIETHLQSAGEETQQLKDMYPDIMHVADVCCNQIGYLEDSFGIVTQNDDSQLQMKRYRSAVQDGDGKRVEEVMLDLLYGAVLVALEPLVSDEQIKELREALEEVKLLPPSLDEGPTGIVIVNSGSGNHFYHGGKGNQNHCSGGFQVTGNVRSENYSFPVFTSGELDGTSKK